MEAMNWQPRNPFGGCFDEPFGMFGDFLEGRMLFPGFGRGMLIPMLALPRIDIQMGEEPEAEAEGKKVEAKIPADAGEELRGKRELIALKHQLSDAVRAEDFEKAIELRDRIMELEK
jgi:hypothetical protein